MFKKITLIFLSVFIRNISYGIEITAKNLDFKNDKDVDNQLFIESNQGMQRVEIPRRAQYFDAVQGYLNVVHECKKECCNCNCKENASLCCLLCVSFTALKCILG